MARRLLMTVALAVGVTAALTTPVQAGESEVDVAAIGLARDRGISVAEADQRLEWQAAAPDLAERVERELGAAYGGLWIAVDNGDRITIGVTDARAAATARAAAAAAGLGDVTDIQTVRRSMAELLAASAWIGNELVRVNAGAPYTLISGIRTDRNMVALQLPERAPLTPAQTDLVAASRARYGDMLEVGTYQGAPQGLGCVYPDCDPPLRGGVRITALYGNTVNCTAGFIGRSPSLTKYYLFTSGHCGAFHDYKWGAFNTSPNIKEIGWMHNWQFHTGGDMAILNIDDPSGWGMPSATVYVTSSPDTTYDANYKIFHDKYSVLGQRLCTTGAFLGLSDCGTVWLFDVTATYYGTTVQHLGRVNICTKGGDSGAPMYAKHSAFGLMAASVGTCDALYQGIKAAETALNANVLHAT